MFGTSTKIASRGWTSTCAPCVATPPRRAPSMASVRRVIASCCVSISCACRSSRSVWRCIAASIGSSGVASEEPRRPPRRREGFCSPAAGCAVCWAAGWAADCDAVAPLFRAGGGLERRRPRDSVDSPAIDESVVTVAPDRRRRVEGLRGAGDSAPLGMRLEVSSVGSAASTAVFRRDNERPRSRGIGRAPSEYGYGRLQQR